MLTSNAKVLGRLLAANDPAPFEIVHRDSGHAIVLVCEHAGRGIPRALGTLGLSAADLETHVAWDIGAAEVARRTAGILAAPLVLQRYSRLVIDCNRPTTALDSVPVVSHDIVVPGNADISPQARQARIDEIFIPFHGTVSSLLDVTPRAAAFSVHSFTPVLAGMRRKWDISFSFRKDPETSTRLAAALRLRRPEVHIGINEPYSVDDASDWFVPVHCETRGIAHSLIEIRNDHLLSPGGCEQWGRLLADCINDVLKEH